MNDRKTIREWEQEFELNIVDMDGFDKRDPHLFERLFTKAEFEKAIAFCTVIRKAPKLKTHPFLEHNRYSGSETSKVKHRKQAINIHMQRIWFLYVCFPMPSAITYLLKQLFRLIHFKIRVPWYYPLSFCILGLCILLLEPVTTLVAGPFYLWYLILGFIANMLGILYFQLITSTFHKGAIPPDHNPFLSSVNLFGNPVNLYFSLGKAITSSIVIAILIVCAYDLLKQLASTNSAR